MRRALALSLLSIALNAVFGSIAVAIGVASASLSLLGFGLDSAIDSVASIVLVWRFTTEAHEPHRAERIEHLAETAIGAVLLALGAYLTVTALGALATGAHPESTAIRTALLLIALAVLPPLAVTKHRTARALASGALRADSILTAVAALLALIGLGSLLLDTSFGLTWADAAGALIIAAIVAREGWSSLRLGRVATRG